MEDKKPGKTMDVALEVLQQAVREELEKKAKLGQQAVVCDRDGKPKVVSAKYLVRKMREEERRRESMSKLEQLKSMRDDLYAIARKHNVAKLYVFGSCARGEETPKSDIDLLAEFMPGASLLDHSHMIQDVKKLLNTKVDIVSSRGLHPYIAKRIWKEAVPL